MTMMNREQVQSLLQQLLAAVGPLAALAIQLGYPQGQVDGWVRVVQAVLGVGTIVASIIWGNAAHTDAAKVAAAAGPANAPTPGVTVTIDRTTAAPALVAAANDQSNAVKMAA